MSTCSNLQKVEDIFIWDHKNSSYFKISPTDKIVPHRGKVFVAFIGNYFGPGKDNVLTVSMWRQFK